MSERGRPRNFDRQEALRHAMNVFWEKGFEDASMNDLTRAMGIASPSLYAAFGSKEALFREAVDLYQATEGLETWASLEAEPRISGAIEAFLANTARAYSRPDVPSGCLVILGSRPASADAGEGAVGNVLKARRAENIERLCRRFVRAVAQGDLPRTFDCDAAAAFYAALQNGMSLLARDGADLHALMAVARSGVSALDGLARSPPDTARIAPTTRTRSTRKHG